MVLFLSDHDVDRVLNLQALVSVVGEALASQAAGSVECPDRPHYLIGHGIESDDPAGTALAMPAYIHGSEFFATTLVSIHEDNTDHGLLTINARIVLSNA